MAGDQFQDFQGRAEHFRCTHSDVLMRYAVKAVLSDLVLFGYRVGQGISVGVVRDGLVECGVEYRDVWDVG